MNQLSKSVGAGNPHATFCGNRGRATASGDPVLEVKSLRPTHHKSNLSVGRFSAELKRPLQVPGRIIAG